MNRSEKLSWVQGNDVLLYCWLYELTTDSADHETSSPFLLEEASDIAVSVVSKFTTTDVTASRVEGEENCLAVEIPSDLAIGTYSVKVTAVVNERDVCSFESPVFAVVATNREANITFRKISGVRNAEFSMDVRIMSGAVTAGQNAYELWIAAGNEGTLDDFLNYYIATVATAEKDGLMSAEDKADFDAIKTMDVMDEADADDMMDRLLN